MQLCKTAYDKAQDVLYIFFHSKEKIQSRKSITQRMFFTGSVVSITIGNAVGPYKRRIYIEVKDASKTFSQGFLKDCPEYKGE